MTAELSAEVCDPAKRAEWLAKCEAYFAESNAAGRPGCMCSSCEPRRRLVAALGEIDRLSVENDKLRGEFLDRMEAHAEKLLKAESTP